MPNVVIKIKRHATEEELNAIRHSGIKGMKWGRRRFQNEDGSLTEAGRKRYGVGNGDSEKKTESTSGNGPKSEDSKLPVPASKLPVSAKRDESDYEDKTKSSKAFDPDEIRDAPKSEPKTEAPKKKPDIYDVPFEDKTSNANRSNAKNNDKSDDSTGSDNKKGPEISEDVWRDAIKEGRRKQAEREEAEKARAAKERERQAEKNKEEKEEAHERAEKERKENAREKKQEEAEKERNAKERERKAKEAERDEKKLDNELETQRKKWNENFDPDTVRRQKEIENLQTAKSITGDASTIAREASNVIGRTKVNVPRMKLDHLSNKEMRDAIDRDILERQYDQAFNTNRAQAEARRERAQSICQNIGSVITVTGAALGIAVAIKQLQRLN